MLVMINMLMFINRMENGKWKFELTRYVEPDLYYLAINDYLEYIYVAEYDEEYKFYIPQKNKTQN